GCRRRNLRQGARGVDRAAPGRRGGQRVSRRSLPHRKRRVRACLRWVALASLSLSCGLVHAQREFRVYDSFEGPAGEAELPPDYNVPGELVVGRLMYPSFRGFGFGRGGWRSGGTSWTV